MAEIILVIVSKPVLIPAVVTLVRMVALPVMPVMVIRIPVISRGGVPVLVMVPTTVLLKPVKVISGIVVQVLVIAAHVTAGPILLVVVMVSVMRSVIAVEITVSVISFHRYLGFKLSMHTPSLTSALPHGFLSGAQEGKGTTNHQHSLYVLFAVRRRSSLGL